MRKLCLFAVLIVGCLLNNHVAAAQVIVKGKVIDKASQQPIEGAIVINEQSKTVVTTDAFGWFSIAAVDSSITILVSNIGYRNIQVQASAGKPAVIALEQGSIDLDAIIVSATSHDNHVRTIAKVDLAIRPVRSSQEILRMVPGLFIAQHAGGGKAEQIFLRGFDIDHGTDIQLTVDGIPINMVSHGHGQGYADLHFLIPELVKETEFGKGPYYAEKGNLNTSGYVSFHTVNTVQDKLQVEAGGYNSARLLAMVNLLPKENQKQTAYIASELQYFDGPFKSPQQFNRFNLFGKYQLQLRDRVQLTVLSSAFSSNWDASGQIPVRAVEGKLIDRFGAIDDTEGGYTGRYNLSGKITSAKSDRSFELQGYYSRYYFNLYSNFTFFLRDSVNGDQIKQKDERDIFGFNSSYSFNRSSGALRFKTTIGASFRLDKTYATELSYTSKRNFLSAVKLGNITESNASAFIDEKITAGKWQLNMGGRIDHLFFVYADKLSANNSGKQSKSIISPKINIQYAWNKKLKLFFKAGKGFHSNDARVVIENNGRQILPKAYGTDLGFIVFPAKNLTVTSSAWYLYMEQEFVYVGDEGVIEPSGRTARFGLDVSARYQVTKELFADVDMNIAHPKFIDAPKDEAGVPLAPLFTSTGGATYKSKRFASSLRYRYISNRPANETNTVTASGYFITDLSAELSLKRFQLGVAAENLFNVKWNEAQFDTESRLKNEAVPVSELHFTPGLPLMVRFRIGLFL